MLNLPPRSSLSLSPPPPQISNAFDGRIPPASSTPASFGQPLPVLHSKSRIVQRFWRGHAQFTVKRVAKRYFATGFVASKIKDMPVEEWVNRFKSGEVSKHIQEPLRKLLALSAVRHRIPTHIALDLSVIFNAYTVVVFPNQIPKADHPIYTAVKSAAADFVFSFESILQFASNSTDGVMGIPKQLTREFPQHLQSMLEQGGAWKRFLQQIRVFKLRRSVIALHASLEAFQGYRDPSTKHQLVEMITAARTFLGGLEGGRELARLDEELQLAPPPQHSQVFFALNGQALIWHHRHTVNHEDTAMQLVIDPAFAYKTSQWTDVPMQNRSMDERTPLFWKLVKEEVENQEYHNLFTIAEDARTFLVGLSEGQGLLTSTQMLALPVPVPRQRMLDIARAFHPHFRRVMPADQRDEDEELWMEAVDNFHATASHADALIHLFRSIYRSHTTALVVGTNMLCSM